MEENKKEELLAENLSEDELKSVAGGGCWNSARFVAPDGHDVGCAYFLYYDEASKIDFNRSFKSICWEDGRKHDTDGRQYCGDGHYRVLCSKCHQYMDMDGNWSDDMCAIVDEHGNYIGMNY